MEGHHQEGHHGTHHRPMRRAQRGSPFWVQVRPQTAVPRLRVESMSVGVLCSGKQLTALGGIASRELRTAARRTADTQRNHSQPVSIPATTSSAADAMVA